MPDVSRTRAIEASPDRVWGLVSDPYNLPRWYPETARVENVNGEPGALQSGFTQVMETRGGTPVRADFRCIESAQGERVVWEQQIEGTPFERFLRRVELEVEIDPHERGSAVTIGGRRGLRGLSRLGAPMMRQATRRTLDAALDGIEFALGESGP